MSSKVTITNSEILDLLKQANDKLGHPPTKRQFKKFYSFPSTSLIELRFGGWHEALHAAGLSSSPNIRSPKAIPISKEEAIADIHRVAKLVKGTPTVSAYYKHGKFSKFCVLRATGFESFTELYVSLGYDRVYAMTKEQVKKAMLAVYNDLGYTPSIDTFKKHPLHKLSIRLIYQHYSSYQDLIDELGLPPVTSQPAKSRYVTKDGHLVQSRLEKDIDDFLYDSGIVHAIQQPICKERNWTCDFYIPKMNLFLEADGLQSYRSDQSALQDKIDFYKSEQMNFLVVYKDTWSDQLAGVAATASP